MGFWSIFSASDKAVEAAGYAVKKGVDGLDNLFYSDEEQAGDAMKRAELRFKFAELSVKKTEQAMDETTAQTLSRRYMAWFIVLTAGFMSWLYVFAEAFSFVGLSKACITMLNYWEWALLAVVAYYFTTHAIRSWRKS